MARVETYHPPTDMGVTIYVTADIYGVPYGSKVHVRPHDCHGAVLARIEHWWQDAATIKDWPPTKVHLTPDLTMSLFSHDDHKTCFTLLAPGHQAATDVAIYCEESPLVVYGLAGPFATVAKCPRGGVMKTYVRDRHEQERRFCGDSGLLPRTRARRPFGR